MYNLEIQKMWFRQVGCVMCPWGTAGKTEDGWRDASAVKSPCSLRGQELGFWHLREVAHKGSEAASGLSGYIYSDTLKLE